MIIARGKRRGVRYDKTKTSREHSRVDCRFPLISRHSTRKYDGSSRFCQVSEIQFIFLLVVDSALQYPLLSGPLSGVMRGFGQTPYYIYAEYP